MLILHAIGFIIGFIIAQYMIHKDDVIVTFTDSEVKTITDSETGKITYVFLPGDRIIINKQGE